MITETKEGTGTNYLGELSRVTSEYKMSKGTTLVAVKGASSTVRGNKIVVTTEYSESISFRIVVLEDDKTAIYPFVHERTVTALPGRTNINQVAATVRPALDVPSVVTPSLEEIDLSVTPIPRVGF